MSTARSGYGHGSGAESTVDRERSGFSMVEMLIAVVITGVVGAALLGVLMEQNAFYEENSRRVMAQKSLRGAVDRMSRELRMVRRGDVQAAEADQLVVTFSVAHGVVCHESGGTSYLYFHDLPASSPEGTRYLEPRFNGPWQTGLSWPGQDGAQTCTAHGAPAGAAADRYRSVGTSLPVGTIVNGTETLTYEFASQNGGLALLRNGDRLAGPFEADPPFFRYLDEDGNSTGNLDEIASVQMRATAQGHDPNPRYEGDRTIELRIPFRN